MHIERMKEECSSLMRYGGKMAEDLMKKVADRAINLNSVLKMEREKIMIRAKEIAEESKMAREEMEREVKEVKREMEEMKREMEEREVEKKKMEREKREMEREEREREKKATKEVRRRREGIYCSTHTSWDRHELLTNNFG
ncbi:hypothetical protein HOY82DRAFT_650567 [Tuber indicum]|nr:hypothetical protein HOY82DRAFT_650567 [Tuber indicum]